MNTDIVIVSGTNRRGSNTRRLANYLAGIYAEQNTSARILDLAEIPPTAFNPDAYEQTPVELKPFCDLVLGAAGLHIIVPEYNGGAPGALKWFIDMLPYPEAFEGRSVAFVGVAAGEWGGLRPVEQLQQVFGYRNTVQYPKRVFVREVDDKLDADGVLTDHEIAERLLAQVKGFREFVQRMNSDVLT